MHTERSTLLVLLLAPGILSLGCSRYVWPRRGADDLRDIAGGNSEESAVVANAVAAADTVYADPRFWRLVEDRWWLASPMALEPMPGLKVVQALVPMVPSSNHYRLTDIGWSKLQIFMGGTIADTDVCGVIRIDEKHIDDVEHMVNTIAHESTHVIGDSVGLIGCVVRPGQQLGYAFTDNGYDDATKVWLVSYTIGDLAQCFYSSTATNEDFAGCFDRTIDRQKYAPGERLRQECCASATTEDERKLVSAVRRASRRCLDVSCEVSTRCSH